ncbi:hypothetical protein H6P81_001733 [Aristolochia fimbriata]|uniref:Uncharacterized protein n=1 Tax=Aristolochia fimbriata TaxID=158543 RepID=A0AAV7FAG9_ARIFI|nr:hypothetical protein H6P81_001733 [Aristolochia fimbriata]
MKAEGHLLEQNQRILSLLNEEKSGTTTQGTKHGNGNRIPSEIHRWSPQTGPDSSRQCAGSRGSTKREQSRQNICENSPFLSGQLMSVLSPNRRMNGLTKSSPNRRMNGLTKSSPNRRMNGLTKSSPNRRMNGLTKSSPNRRMNRRRIVA